MLCVYVYEYTHLCVCIEREISCIEGNFTHVHAHARTRTHTRAHTHTHTCRYGKQEMRQGQRPRAVILAGKAPGKTRPSADRFSPQAHLCAQIGRRFERCGCINAGPWRMFTGWMDATVPCVNLSIGCTDTTGSRACGNRLTAHVQRQTVTEVSTDLA